MTRSDSLMRTTDLVEIQQTAALYAHMIDKRAWERLDEVYALDGVYDASAVGLGVHSGVGEIAKFLSDLNLSIHHGTNMFVDSWHEDGTRAHGYSKFLSVQADGVVTSGEYDDDWIRTAGGWRLHRRASRVLAPVGYVAPGRLRNKRTS